MHTCVAPGCKKRPSFGQQHAPATRCSQHRIPGDVDVVNPMCRALDCMRGAIFGGPDTAWTRAFCKRHCLSSHVNLAYLRPFNLTAAALRNSSKDCFPGPVRVTRAREANPLKFGHASPSLLARSPLGHPASPDQASPLENWWGQDGVLVVPSGESMSNGNSGKMSEAAVWPPELVAGSGVSVGAAAASTAHGDPGAAVRNRVAWAGARESLSPQSLHRIQDVLGGWEPPPSPGAPRCSSAAGGDGACRDAEDVPFSPLLPSVLNLHPDRLAPGDGTVDTHGWHPETGLLPARKGPWGMSASHATVGKLLGSAITGSRVSDGAHVAAAAVNTSVAVPRAASTRAEGAGTLASEALQAAREAIPRTRKPTQECDKEGLSEDVHAKKEHVLLAPINATLCQGSANSRLDPAGQRLRDLRARAGGCGDDVAGGGIEGSKRGTADQEMCESADKIGGKMATAVLAHNCSLCMTQPAMWGLEVRLVCGISRPPLSPHAPHISTHMVPCVLIF